MSDFEQSIATVLAHEAGYVNNPDDAGGPTNFGITIKSLSAFRGRPCTADDIVALTREEAEDIYHHAYWDPLQLDWFTSTGLMIAVFDQAVVRGIGAVIRDLQNLAGVHSDGVMGAETLAAIRRMDAGKLLVSFLAAQQIHYAQLCVSKPSQLTFLVGWLARTHSLLLSCIPHA